MSENSTSQGMELWSSVACSGAEEGWKRVGATKAESTAGITERRSREAVGP